MQTWTISPQLVMLCWKKDEMIGDSPEQAARKLLILVCEGCLEAGWLPERMTELEIWAEPDGLVAIVSLCRREKEWFRFSSLPEGLQALTALPCPPAEGLVNYEGNWFLCGTEEQSRVLSEFGAVLNDLEAAETDGLGERVVDGAALERLWRAMKKEGLPPSMR